MRKLSLIERETLNSEPVSEINDAAGLVIENGEIVGVEE